jgi:phosphoglycolate phosphatase
VNRYSTVLFDLDGTLLDTSEGIINGVEHTAKKLGLPTISRERMFSFIGPPVLESFVREFKISIEKAKEAVQIYRTRYEEKGLYEAKRYKNIENILDSLKKIGMHLGIATLKRDDFAKKIISHFSMSSYFECVFGIDSNDTKSKSEIIKSCIVKMSQNEKAQIVYIGDSEYDAMGAQEAGIDFIAVTYGFGFKDAVDAQAWNPIAVVQSVENLLQILK